MNLLMRLEQLHGEARRNQWIRDFAVFCRIALALGFIPAGLEKVTGHRFTALPSNHPLGHYFDALFLTDYYYTFIGIGQLTAALLLLIPRTTLLGAIVYLPIIANICVLTYATRFEGTRIATLMLLANLFLLTWDFDRLKHILPFGRTANAPYGPNTTRFPVWFFGFVLAAVVAVIMLNSPLVFDMRPGNSRLECTNGCKDSRSPNNCQHFCDCIFNDGKALKACLAEYRSATRSGAEPANRR